MEQSTKSRKTKAVAGVSMAADWFAQTERACHKKSGFSHKLFGFSVSSNVPIPGLPPAEIEDCDLSIIFGSPTDGRDTATPLHEELVFASPSLTESGEPTLRLFSNSSARLHLQYSDGIEFWLDADAGQLWSTWPEHLTLEDAASYLLGPVMGLFLRSRGIACLHASAVVLHGHAVLFMGDAGAGKSTTAALMTRRGHALLADDIVAITERDGSLLAIPAYPHVSLWADSARLVCQAMELPSICPSFEKKRFSPEAFEQDPVPLACVFVLGERACDEQCPRIDRLSPQQHLLALIANSYATLVMDESARAAEFPLLGQIACHIPIRQLVSHSDPAHSERLCELIESAIDTILAGP